MDKKTNTVRGSSTILPKSDPPDKDDLNLPKIATELKIASLTFSGVYTALVTPLKADGQVDYEGLNNLVALQIEQGINGLVAVGTTGESPTLTHSEHIAVVKAIVETTAGRIPVVAGVGSNNTAEAMELTQLADKAGADALMLVAPYYNKPNQEGLFQHCSKIAAVTEKPIILYSIPSRCGIAIEVATAARLYAKHPHVCAIKEAGGDANRVSQLRQSLGDSYMILSGDDSLTLPFMAVGAQGVISVASNLVVTDLVKMVDYALKNDFASAERLHRRYYPLFKDLFIEPNPVPIKEALYESGILASKAVRSPLCPMSPDNRTRLLKTLKELEIPLQGES